MWGACCAWEDWAWRWVPISFVTTGCYRNTGLAFCNSFSAWPPSGPSTYKPRHVLCPRDLCLQIAPVWASLYSQHLGQWCKLLRGRTQKWAQLIRPMDSRERSDSLIFNSSMSKTTSVQGTRLKLFFVWSGAAIWPQVSVPRRFAVASTPQGCSLSVSYHSSSSLGKTLCLCAFSDHTCTVLDTF